MQLIDHVSITVQNLPACRAFYVAVMAALDAGIAYDRPDAIGFGERNRPASDGHSYISVLQSASARPDARRHWCFRAQSIAQVQAFHAAGIATGGKNEGAPGLRTYHTGYYAAFLLDPEGNKLEAAFHRGDR